MNTVLETFYGDLNKLKLDQFPCGSGKWREEQDPGYIDKGDANHETLLALEELAHSDVFNVQCEWSDDIKSLRQLAVHQPHVISESFIFQHFTTLRLVDRNINEVDRGLLKFTQLKELSLTGNSLTSIKGSHLPRSLTILQLFANKFSDIQQLTINPPPNLQHLGLGYNQLADISPYISPFIWPSLLSLDISHNKLGDVKSTIDCLSALPTLRNLSLLANPITLAPGYAGCTLDMIPQLQILDDVSISDDDRLNFTGISLEHVRWNEAIFSVVLSAIQNLRQPPQNEAIDENACYYPRQKKYSYFVRFNFLAYSGVQDNTPGPPLDATDNMPLDATDNMPLDATDNTPGALLDATDNMPEAPLDATGNMPGPPLDAPDTISLGPQGTPHPPPSPVSKEIADVVGEGEASSPYIGTTFETEDLPWEEQLKFEKPIIIRCADLPQLQEFLSAKLQLVLVEKVVECFTTIAPPNPVSATPPPSGKGKKGGKEPKEKKKKEESAVKVMKDKEGNILKWLETAPSFNEIAHINADISSLLQSNSVSGGGKCTITEKPATATPATEEGRQSSCSNRGGKKKAGGKKKVVTPVPVAPPEPLTLEYRLERISWSNKEECRSWTTEQQQILEAAV